jgi:SAM-dependent methyltransferase
MTRRRNERSTLRAQLVKAGRTRWLDVGCGNNIEPGFLRMDTYPVTRFPVKERRGYIRGDILRLGNSRAARLGGFDVVRLQHVFEHFTFEDGAKVLKNCARLLKSGGIMLITVPDLKVHIRRYLHNQYKTSSFRYWAHERIPKNSPNSFYFAMFAHSSPHEQHKWCYDYEGLRYQLAACGEFKSIRHLSFRNPLASYPFTHNRPDEDVCAMAVKR